MHPKIKGEFKVSAMISEDPEANADLNSLTVSLTLRLRMLLFLA